MPEQIPRDPAFFGRVGNRFRAVLLVMLAAIWPLFRGHSFDKVYVQWTHLLCLAMTWVVPFLMADGRIFDTLRCFPKSWHRFMVLCVSGFFNGNSFLFVDRHRPYLVHVQVEIAVNSSPAWPPNSRCQFDSSCGFPGEGWTLSSINVGSLEKHPEALMHKTNCLAIQETRVTNYNLVKVNLEASNNSLTLHHGALMKYLPGGLPEYGGVAIASACGSSKPYDPKDDCSRIYQNLVASGRCTAAWVAVSDRLTLLVVSVYGFSGAQSDSSKMARTNQLFRDIFEWLSQHGEIPIAIAADFQAEPHMYPCIAEAMSFGAFHDVLTQFNEDGMCRPITYSRDSAWVGGPATSIDGILLNNCALQYLQDVKVHVSKGLQHAFVDATFQWPSNRSDDRSSNLQWVPHASFDLTQLKSESERTKIAQDLWEKEFRELTNDAFSAESLMTVANDFAIKILTMSGARWKHGSQKRGTFPDLKPFNRFACCQNTKDQNTKTLMAISKAICRLDDISFKISNPVMKQHAESIVVAAWKRVRTLVKSLKGPFLPIWPSQETVNEVWDFLVSARDKLVQKIRLERIQKWRQRMKVSALSNCSDIFTYLRRKNSEFGYMTVTDSHGMPFYHQDDALALAASQWNEVFEANKEHIPSEPVLEVIHDALKKRAFPISLPLLTDECLKSAVDKRKQTASPGVDGWRTAELQALPAIAFAPWARLWNKIEDGSFRLPTIFQCARLVMLPKPDAKSLMPIDKRLITLMCVPYIMWSKARFDHLQEWQQKVFPPTLCGGIQGRQAADIAHIIAARCEHAIAFQKPICGIKLDRSKCFDRIIPRIVADFAKILGMDPKFLKVWLQVYEDFRRFLCMGHAISKSSLSNLNGVAQGDAASVVAINILMTGWTAIVESIPGIEHFAFIDDCYLLALESNVENLAAALTGTKLFDKLVGQKLNIDKSSGFATSRTAKKKLANAIPALPIHDTFAVLGTFVKTNAKRITIDPKNTAQGVRAILHDIEHLPISLRKKAFLISMKAVSKFLYHPEVIPWPKATIDSMVNSVAKALWGNRPGWRNQELLFALCTNPIACHPHMSIATRVICNIVARCKRDEGFFLLVVGVVWSE